MCNLLDIAEVNHIFFINIKVAIKALGDFFRIQYLAFGWYFVVLNAIFGFGSAKTIL